MRAWNELSMAEKADIMKLAIDGGVYDLDAIRSGYNEYARGGKIHIKPENRGKFTALKKRTGHSATWFKEHGTPAQKKMAVFAINARKWKHGDGGELDTYDEPQTFAGRVAEVVGASPSIVRGTDVVSSVAQMTPWGHYVAATDLGRDLNRVYHKENGAKKDVAFDLLSMLPGISAPGLKAAENAWNTIKGNNKLRKALNAGIITGRVADFVNDTWGANKTSKALGGNLFDGTTEDSQQMITTGGAGYVPPAIDVSKTKQSINKRLYKTISPLEASYSLLPTLQSFLSNKEYDDTRDGINEQYPVGTVDAIWAKYLQVPEKDRRYSDRLEKSSYRPSKGSNSDNYYKLPLKDYEKESLVNTTRELPLYKNKVSKLLNNYALGEHTVGRGYDNHGEYASYFDVFDINPFNGKYGGINIPIVNKLDDIGIGKPVRIYDRIYLDDYYGVKEPTHATYLPEVTVTGKKRRK